MADFKHKPHRDRDSAGQLRKGNSKWQIPSRLASAFVRTSSTTSTRYRTAIKAVEKLVAAGNKAAAAEEFKKTSGILDRLSCRHVLHKNAAARQKSRLSAAIKAMA